MRVEHGGANVSVTQQFLDCADVIPRLQHMGGEAMPKRVATRRLQYAGLTNGLLMDMMAYGPSGVRIGAKRGCGEYVLPAPLRRVCRIFVCQRIRQRYTRLSRSTLLIKAKTQLGKVHSQWIQDRHNRFERSRGGGGILSEPRRESMIWIEQFVSQQRNRALLNFIVRR
jgi:hypothetical protein